MRDVLDLIGDLLVPLAMLISAEWMVAYHRSTRGAWRRSSMGRHLMVFMGVLTAAFAVVVTRSIWVELLGHEDHVVFRVIRLGVFTAIPAVLIWRRILLYQAQRERE